MQRGPSGPGLQAFLGQGRGCDAVRSGANLTQAWGLGMQLPQIVQTGHPILRERAAEVTVQQIKTPQFQELVDRMIAVMRQAPGVGLAAPQIGVSLRVIVLEDTEQAATLLAPQERHERERDPFPLRVFVNPILRPQGQESRMFFEGCLSITGYAALVERHRHVEASGLDQYGQPQTWLTHGWAARILQHEVDHLDGVLYVDRMITRSFATSEHVRTHYANRRTAELKRIFKV
jgi:peptide deformylase